MRFTEFGHWAGTRGLLVGCEIEIESNKSSAGAAPLNSISYRMGYMLIEVARSLAWRRPCGVAGSTQILQEKF
jgi:hypothetical protein